MKVSYDPKCAELARYFLTSDSGAAPESDVQRLAGAIQRTIEDWIADWTWRRLAAATEPDDESGQE
jgi:hypothetical protein